MTEPSLGFQIVGRFGTLAKCAHCEKTNIRRTNKGQITCGSRACRQKQNSLTARLLQKKRAVKA